MTSDLSSEAEADDVEARKVGATDTYLKFKVKNSFDPNQNDQFNAFEVHLYSWGLS